MKINRQDTNGVKPLLAVGELGYDNYPSGGDIGRVYVGTGSSNIAQAKKSEVVTVDGKVDTHVARIDNPHGVTKAQVGLSNVDNTADSTKVVASAGKWTTGRIINGTTVDGTVNITTSQWGASRNITIGNTLKTVNGSGDVSWTLTEIGAIGTSSPAFTGIPTAPTAAVGTSNTVIATTEFVNAEIANDAIPRVVSTDNAIVRFDGTTGAVQNSNVVIDDNGNLIITAGSLKGSYGAGNIASNTAIGDGALQTNTTGNYNTANGVSALFSNTTGYYNTANGISALQLNTTGYNNTANGVGALYYNTTGYNNTANGVNALYSNTTGYNNTANGISALLTNTTGNYNTASGANALYSNTTGYYNTANGVNALYYNTTGYNNTANGVGALYYNTTGYNNTANGVNALYSNTTGYYNTANGVSALYYNTTYANVSGFGYNSQVTGSNQVQLGDASTTTYVYGTVQNRSDIRDKADIRDTILGLDFIQSLRPVDYRWDMRDDYKPERPELEVPKIEDEEYEVKKAEYDLLMAEWLESCKHENIIRDGSKKRTRYHQGFIAQEVLALDVDFGGIQDHSVRGGEDVLSIGYDEIIAPLVKAVQEQQAMIDTLKARIEILEGAK